MHVCVFPSHMFTGYSIFVIRGKLPDNEADQVLRLMPAVQTKRPTTLAESNQQRPTTSSGASSSSSSNIVSLGDLQSALEANKALMSGEGRVVGGASGGGTSQDQELQDAIKLSMQGETEGLQLYYVKEVKAICRPLAYSSFDTE